MNATQKALFERVMAFEIDEPGVELTFARRLARENGWSQRYANRVIAEYKKFLFLAMAADHVVSPSEQVDQAWHMHLTYTRSYWDELCRKVLGKPLHHGPTKGGAAEQAKFIDLYNQTLASYERLLGEKPPSDIWPPAGQRFGEDLQHVSVNTARHWIIPKPRWRMTGSAAVFPAAVFVMPLAAATWNPLDWKGPEFLTFYIAIAIIAFVAALVVRLINTVEARPVDAKDRAALDPYEVACLAGGPVRAVQAAFAAMVRDGSLKLVENESKSFGFITTKQTKIHQGTPPAKSAPRLEHALYEAAFVPANDLTPLTEAGKSVAQQIEEDLKARGLVQSGGPSGAAVAAGLIMAAPLVVGVPKLLVGLSRGRPIEFLAMACIATAVAALIFLLARSRLTTQGRRSSSRSSRSTAMCQWARPMFRP
jgi:uncharacterized protein (TIGR04222 family)